jgi:hypothetical protein
LPNGKSRIVRNKFVVDANNKQAEKVRAGVLENPARQSRLECSTRLINGTEYSR